MDPVNPLRRRLAVALLALLGCALVSAPGVATASVTRGLTSASDVFTGTVARATKVPGVAKRPARFVYAIDVDMVFKGDVSTARVEVRTSSAYEKCTGPNLDRATSYAFLVSTQGSGLVAADCNDIRVASPELLKSLQARFGPARSPLEDSQQPKPDPYPAVQYRAADVGEPATFNRSAAPGLALVIVGLLGLFVVRRMARPRS